MRFSLQFLEVTTMEFTVVLWKNSGLVIWKIYTYLKWLERQWIDGKHQEAHKNASEQRRRVYFSKWHQSHHGSWERKMFVPLIVTVRDLELYACRTSEKNWYWENQNYNFPIARLIFSNIFESFYKIFYWYLLMC